MPKGKLKVIENAFDLLLLFKSLPAEEKTYWQGIMKTKHRWFQPNEVLLQKDQRVSTAYLIVRGVVECKMENTTVRYRSGNMIGIDALFSENFQVQNTYSVCGGLLEAYSIDTTLLDRFFKDKNLAPFVYREIAIHVLSNNYHADLDLNRLQISLLLHTKATFYQCPLAKSIQLKRNQRLFILAGSVTRLLDGQNHEYQPIDLQLFDTGATIFPNSSVVAFSWMREAEESCRIGTNREIRFPLLSSNFLSHNLFYPGERMRFREQQCPEL
jgi:hypothetical protein